MPHFLPQVGLFYFMENLTMYIPKSHIDEMMEMMPQFEGMVTSMAEVSSNVEMDEPYAKVELLIPDYSVLYFMGYSAGSSSMSRELQPILANCEAKLMHLRSKIMELEFYRTLIENYKSQENE